MASNVWGLALGAVPGLLALLGAAVGYGRLTQRLATVETKMTKVENLANDVARIDERTLNTAKGVEAIDGKLTVVTEHLLSEARAFTVQTLRQGRARG